MTTSAAVTGWLAPLQAVLDPSGPLYWGPLEELATALDTATARHPIGREAPVGAERSHRLLAIRRELCRLGFADKLARPASFHMFAQFICGYVDLDLRDATGLGHGQLIASHGSPEVRHRWVAELRAGDLAGIAITEAHGGSCPAAARTSAVAGPSGTWLISGHKTWISRLSEAAVFIVFFRAPHGSLAAAVVAANHPGLRRHLIEPAGLSGWSWGTLDLDSVPVSPEDVLAGDGMDLLREHFAHYRPLVTATALGAAAALYDIVAGALGARLATGVVPRLRDSALVTLGRSRAELVNALLGAIAACRLAEDTHPDAELWSAAMKAQGVDVANRASAEVALLLGAAGFRADSPVSKIRRDLAGLLYADGIHDSLFRTAGKGWA